MTKSKHGKLPLRIAVGTKNLGKVKNNTTNWSLLMADLSNPTVTKESFARYLKLPKEDQDRLKNVNGYWIGGHCRDGRRAANAIAARDIVCFDIDTAPAAIVDQLEMGLTGISKFEFAVHSTRKHTGNRPRLRISFPLAHPVPADKFTPFVRILASKLDPTMDTVDDVSFRIAQMMYRPSHSADSEWVFFHNAGDLVDPDEVLEAFGEWQDYTKLPFSEAQGQKRPSAKKAEDPTTKKGVIGAFCRAYDVEQAMATFLPDIYAPGDDASGKPRYTFLGGSTSNGAVVEDRGLFLYSHHTTDPVTDRLVNSFDLVRIHKFGDEDKGKEDEAESPAKLPSFKAMVDFLADDEATKRELAAEQYDTAAMFDDSDVEFADEPEEDRGSGAPAYDADIEALLGSGAPATVVPKKGRPPKPSEWFPDDLELNEDGGIKATLPNVATIVQNDVRTWGVVARNEFTGQIVARRSLIAKTKIVPPIFVEDTFNGDNWSDIHDVSIRAIIESPNGRGKAGYGFKISDRDLHGGVILAALLNKFHPVRQYFNSIEWDGEGRLKSLLTRYLGCPDTPYHRDVIQIMLVAAVTRVYEPGHKFDSAMVIEGPQGIGKSTFIRVLARHRWFSELQGDMGDQQKMVEQMLGYLILELPELAGLRKSEVDDTKSFLSRTEDTVRLAYDRRATTLKRQCVFFGSTNDSKYLKDPTGNRRFWPVKVVNDRIDIVALDAEMDQVWAEAVTVYRDMRTAQPHGILPLYLADRRSVIEAQDYQEAARLTTQIDEWSEDIQAWLDRPVRLPQLLSEYDDEPGFGERDEPMVQRCAFRIKDAWTYGLGVPHRASNPAAIQMLDSAVGRIEGWVRESSNSTRKFGGLKGRWKVRADATPREREQGYRVVDNEGSDLL